MVGCCVGCMEGCDVGCLVGRRVGCELDSFVVQKMKERN